MVFCILILQIRPAVFIDCSVSWLINGLSVKFFLFYCIFIWICVYLIYLYHHRFVVCFSFSCHCFVHVYFHTERRVSQNSLHSAPPEWCLSSLHVWRICKSCVCVCVSKWRKKRLWSCVTLSSESCKACLFLDLPHNNTQLSPHTHYLAHTALRAHWENKRQP